jgi:serine/threonine protein kinase
MRPVPPTVGKYQVLELLAVGGMAELYKARAHGEHGFAKLVVLKKILPHLAADPTFVQMFIDEARLTAQLDHPNIVHVFELGTDADTPYIAMQYVDGIDVLALLRECARTQIRIPPQLAALIAREVLDASSTPTPRSAPTASRWAWSTATCRPATCWCRGAATSS